MIYYGFWCCKYANGTASLLHSMRCDKQKHFTHTKQKQKRSRPILCRSHTSQSQTLEPISVAVFAYDVPVSQSKYNSMVYFVCPFVCYCVATSDVVLSLSRSYQTRTAHIRAPKTEAEKGIGFIYL